MLKIKIILEYCIQPVKYMKYKIKVLLLNHQLQKQLIKTLIIKRSNLTNKMIKISRKILIVARIKMLQIINIKHPGNSIRHYQITNQFLNKHFEYNRSNRDKDRHEKFIFMRFDIIFLDPYFCQHWLDS